MTNDYKKKYSEISDFQYDYDVPKNEDGVVAIGGDLSNKNLIAAYSIGIFPWYNDHEDILWWSPNPRCILIPSDFHIPKRLSRDIRKTVIHISFNTTFKQIIANCAAPRMHQEGTWLNEDMINAYNDLHTMGWSHSVEVWTENTLIGGLYGVAIDRVFFAESMYSRTSNASKFALLALCHVLKKHHFALSDCLVPSAHLFTLGAKTIKKINFLEVLKNNCSIKNKFIHWPTGKTNLNDFI